MIDTSYIWKHWKPVHLSKAGTLLWKLHIYNSFYKCTYKYKIRHSTFIMWIYLCNIISWKNNSILKESCRNFSSRSIPFFLKNDTTVWSIWYCPILDHYCGIFWQINKQVFLVLSIRNFGPFWYLKSDFWYSRIWFLALNHDNS